MMLSTENILLNAQQMRELFEPLGSGAPGKSMPRSPMC